MRRHAIVIAAAAVLAVTGCGSNHSTDKPHAQAWTHLTVAADPIEVGSRIWQSAQGDTHYASVDVHVMNESAHAVQWTPLNAGKLTGPDGSTYVPDATAMKQLPSQGKSIAVPAGATVDSTLFFRLPSSVMSTFGYTLTMYTQVDSEGHADLRSGSLIPLD